MLYCNIHDILMHFMIIKTESERETQRRIQREEKKTKMKRKNKSPFTQTLLSSFE